MSRRTLGGSGVPFHVRPSELLAKSGNNNNNNNLNNKSTKTLHCLVFFLDDSQHSFDVEKRSKGQALLDLVFRHCELVDKDFFGLQFSEKASSVDGMRWLDPVKCIKKQIKVGPPFLLYFRVKFYVSDPSKLQEEWTRYYFFLQLKKDILEGRLIVPPATAALLASYAVQSELGDYNPEDHKHGYLADVRLVPHQTEELEEKIAELHTLHRGQTSADAEYNFLEQAKRLDMYGVDLHRARVRDSAQSEIQLGVTSYGLVVFQNSVRINTFSWAKIVKISFKRKQFFIQLRREGTESYDNLLGFNMPSYRSCKNLWKSCVEHHTFFRLNVPRPTTKRFLFRLGSRFRYSGRTEYQTLEDMRKRGLDDRPFARSPSKRCVRQTVPVPSEAKDKKPSKMVPRMNGTSNSHVRPYDSFSHKVQISDPEYLPRKAWALTPSSEVQAFTPAIPPKMIRYADDDSLPELIMSNGGTGVSEDASHVRIRMRADEQGRFGFNVKGGADQRLPILVSRVVPNTPADTCVPRLNEGDQLLLIDGKDVSGLSHEQVVKLIRTPKDNGELVLTVRPQVYVGDEAEEPDFQYIPDSSTVATKGPRSGALGESMLLLAEGLESGATIAQFEQLYRKKPDTTMKAARLPANLNKNRYRDISPYDITRVVLSEGTSGDYINASYVNMNIPTSGIVNRYIATQGPLPNTTVDFWEMVWEQQSTLVVMLTTLIERGRIKCHKYWPNLYETETYGKLQVSCVREKETTSFAFREFTLINTQNKEERHITHMQYLAWPDHGVPDDASDFLSFVQQVRHNRDGMVEPTVVHCSAGIGRTGVLILMETAMCLVEANEPVYPLDITRHMRDQRAMLIQTASQYKFVCEAVLKVHNEGIVKPLPEYQRCLTTTV